ncbi:hypothetical protein [Sorangium sp. So ce388]|uniref:hypothetical protein n=1 Tax=Sorangium sp. So ce388 TaxID=3133309 RepID=UPI003F5BCCBA
MRKPSMWSSVIGTAYREADDAELVKHPGPRPRVTFALLSWKRAACASLGLRFVGEDGREGPCQARPAAGGIVSTAPADLVDSPRTQSLLPRFLRKKPVPWGPGRGGCLFERAAASTEARPHGLEIRPKWSAIVDEHPREQGLGGPVRVLDADARQTLATAWFFLRLPDRRWQARLATGPANLHSLARLLVDSGETFMQTDVEERVGLYAEQIGASPRVRPRRRRARLAPPRGHGLAMHLSVDMIMAKPENSDEDRAAWRARATARPAPDRRASALVQRDYRYPSGGQAPDSRLARRA